MGWFNKKKDPISDRARMLQQQIAALENQINSLNTELQSGQKNPPDPKPMARPPVGSAASAGKPAPAPPQTPNAPPPPAAKASPHQPAHEDPAAPDSKGGQTPQPKWRSTTLPQSAKPSGGQIPGDTSDPNPLSSEQLPKNPLKSGSKPSNPREALGVRLGGWRRLTQRIKHYFRAPVTSNPKLVSYLAAGSLHGLRPLRYEKRVARNRTIALTLLLALVIWYLVVMFTRR